MTPPFLNITYSRNSGQSSDFSLQFLVLSFQLSACAGGGYGWAEGGDEGDDRGAGGGSGGTGAPAHVIAICVRGAAGASISTYFGAPGGASSRHRAARSSRNDRSS